MMLKKKDKQKLCYVCSRLIDIDSDGSISPSCDWEDINVLKTNIRVYFHFDCYRTAKKSPNWNFGIKEIDKDNVALITLAIKKKRNARLKFLDSESEE